MNKLIAVNRDAAEETVRDWTQPNTTSTIERYFKAYRDFLRNDDKSGVITASEKEYRAVDCLLNGLQKNSS